MQHRVQESDALWVTQVMHTVQYLHNNYAVLGYFTSRDVILLPDMAVAHAAYAAIAQNELMYTHRQTSDMHGKELARYMRLQARLKKGAFHRNAWIDTRPFMSHLQEEQTLEEYERNGTIPQDHTYRDKLFNRFT